MEDGNFMTFLRNDDNMSWVCLFCGNPFPWEVHPETFRHHLTTICESAPEDVKQAAQRFEGHDSNFNTQTEDSSDAGRDVEAAECSRSVNCEPMRILDVSENNDINFEAETDSNIVRRSNEIQRTTPDALPVVAALEVLMTEGVQSIGEPSSLTKRPVGDAFGRNEEKIWSWLMDDQVLRVGIYDMGGVAKTTPLMRHIQTRLVEESCFEVYWITVSQDFSIFKLQNLIAKEIGLNFSDEEDEVRRAKVLAQAMQAKPRFVLILYDLWNYFDVNEVGIPVGVNSCKLVLTTRFLTVCTQMECSEGNTIRVKSFQNLFNPRNYGLKMIADSYFEQFQSLKILNLTSFGEIKELPRYISDLVNLTALLLSGCKSLIHVPSLAKLEKLKKLDLKGCERLKEMPEGVRFLLKLEYLDLSETGIEEIRSRIIRMLSRLQVLKLCNADGVSRISMRGSEVGELRMLETLHCRFRDVGEFGEYMKSRERSQQSPTYYSIFMKRGSDEYLMNPARFVSRKLMKISEYNFIDPLALPSYIEELHIDSCYGTLYKRLFPPSVLASLLNLQVINVYRWDSVEEIFAMNEGEHGDRRAFPFSNYTTPSFPNHFLLNLKRIDIRFCHKLKKLFHPYLLPNLHNLQEISVGFCNEMEEIFSIDPEEEAELNLSKLTTLRLLNLPELRSIYKGSIICDSLQKK